MAVSSVSSIGTTNLVSRGRLLWALWVLAAIIGGLGFLERLLHGDQATDFSSYIPWGLWVAAYIYFSGLSAGAFLLAAATYVFRIRVLEPIGRLALLLAAVTLPMGLLMIGFDLGHLERAYLVIIRPQFHSMMAWMVWLYTAYLILVVAMLWLSLQERSARQGSRGGDQRSGQAARAGNDWHPSGYRVCRRRRRPVCDPRSPRVLALLVISYLFSGGGPDVWHGLGDRGGCLAMAFT